MSKDKFAAYSRYAKKKGLKSTKQRADIVRTFLLTDGHLSVEDLHHKVQEINPKIGYATVYRTLKLLSDCGIAVERRFDDGQTRYEHLDPEEHHDHLICLGCGEIIEFEDKRIEKLQDELARSFSFRIVTHNLELYGYCRHCK